MSDTRFEQDLRTVLHDLAPAEVPASLREAAAAVPRTHAAPLGRRVQDGRPRLAVLAPLAAVIVLGVVGLIILLGGRFGGNVAAPSPTASPILAWTTLTYEIVASSSASPSPDAIGSDMGVAQSRLRAARVPFTSQASASGFSVTVPAEQANTVTTLIGTTGDMALVPMGNDAVAAGQKIDLSVHPPLFGSDGVQSAASGTDQTGQPTLDLTLTPSAKAAFATYTSAHIAEYFAIVMDGTVLAAPIIQSSIPDGQVQITGSGSGTDTAMQTTLIAVLSSGPLPVPLRQVGSEPATPPADTWTPGPIVAPTPSPIVIAVVPPVAVASELPTTTGTPPAVAGDWTGLQVAQSTGATMDMPRATAWAHGYLGIGGPFNATNGWSSTDGRSWTPWPDGFLGLGSGGAKLVGVAPCRDGALAIIAPGDGLVAATSADGRTWRTVRVFTNTSSWSRYASVAGGSGGAVISLPRGRTILATTDCSTWTQVQLDTPEDTSITGVAAVGSGFVAVGGEQSSTTGAKPGAVAWSSHDGLTWTVAPVVNAAGHAFGLPPAVGAGGLVGLMATPGDTTGAMALYESKDGTSWFPMTADGSALTMQNPDGTWSAAMQFLGDGQRILAYGSPGGDTSKPVEYWVSTDGKAWTTLAVTGAGAATVIAPENAGVYQPVLLRDGILFVNPNGASLFGQAATDAGAANSTPQPSPQASATPNLTVEPLAGGPANMTSLAHWAQGYLATAMDPNTSAPTIYASSDGRTWTAWPAGRLGLGTGKAAFVYLAPCHDGVAVLVTDGSGSTTSSYSTDGSTFATAPLPSTLVGGNGIRSLAGGGPGAAATTDDDRLLLTSDCTSWHSVTLPGSGQRHARGVAALGARLVAVGYTGDPASGAVTHAYAWYSDDGTTWHAVDAKAGDGTGFGWGATASGQAVVAALTNPGVTPGTNQWWISPDGISWHALDTPLGIYMDGAGAGSSAATVSGNGTGLIAWGTVGSVQPGPVSYFVTVTGSTWRPLVPSGPGAAAIGSSNGGYQPFLLGDAILFSGPNDALLGTGDLGALLAAP